MAHYRQTGKAINKFYEQAAGAGKTSDTEKCAKTVAEHAGKGLNRLETEKSDIATTPYTSIACNAMLRNVSFQEMLKRAFK